MDQSIKRLDEDVRKIGRISRKDLEDILLEMQQKSKYFNTKNKF